MSEGEVKRPFGELLRELRIEREMNQRFLAKIAGLGNSTISRIESGSVKPDLNTIEKLAEALQTTTAYLMGWSGDPNDYSDPDFIAEAHSPQYKTFLEEFDYDEQKAGRAYASLTQAERHDAALESDIISTFGFDPYNVPSEKGCIIGRAYDCATLPVQRTVEVALEPYIDKPRPIKIAPSKSEDAEIAAELAQVIKYTELKLYSQSVAAGLGNYIDDDSYEVESFPNVPYRADIAVRISGDSMEPDYHDGDIVFVETDSVLREGEIGIFFFGGDGYIKELRLDPPRLVSLNPKYEDVIINQEYDIPFRTVGRVIGVAEYYK